MKGLDYRVLARNCATDSENTIHADDAARQFGFRAGLTPGVVVFGYAMKPAIDFFGREWLRRGRVRIKLQQPVYDGDEVLVSSDAAPGGCLQIAVSTGSEPATVCAVAEAALENEGRERPGVDDYATNSLPGENERPHAHPGSLIPGTALGTLKLRLNAAESRVFMALGETNAIFLGPDALAHPAVLLELANRVLMRNFRLGPWLHAASTVTNWSALQDGAMAQVRARVADCFERKGHEFVVLDVAIAAEGGRMIQQITHTAIYRPKFAGSADQVETAADRG